MALVFHCEREALNLRSPALAAAVDHNHELTLRVCGRLNSDGAADDPRACREQKKSFGLLHKDNSSPGIDFSSTSTLHHSTSPNTTDACTTDAPRH
jgi:hypothetical protein